MVLRSSLFLVDLVLRLLFPSLPQSVYFNGLSFCWGLGWSGLSFCFYCRFRVRYNLFSRYLSRIAEYSCLFEKCSRGVKIISYSSIGLASYVP
jgi:hypothetical protein